MTTSKLTGREIAASKMLITMLTRKSAEGTTKGEEVRATVAASATSPSTPIYDVRVSINGVELDFHAFEAEIDRQFKDIVQRAAGELLKQTLGDKMDSLMEDVCNTLQVLNKSVQEKASEALGYNPWAESL